MQILTAFVLPKKTVTVSGHVLENTKLMNFTLWTRTETQFSQNHEEMKKRYQTCQHHQITEVLQIVDASYIQGF